MFFYFYFLEIAFLTAYRAPYEEHNGAVTVIFQKIIKLNLSHFRNFYTQKDLLDPGELFKRTAAPESAQNKEKGSFYNSKLDAFTDQNTTKISAIIFNSNFKYSRGHTEHITKNNVQVQKQTERVLTRMGENANSYFYKHLLYLPVDPLGQLRRFLRTSHLSVVVFPLVFLKMRDISRIIKIHDDPANNLQQNIRNSIINTITIQILLKFKKIQQNFTNFLLHLMIFVNLSIKIQILRLLYKVYENHRFTKLYNSLKISIYQLVKFTNLLNLSIYQFKKSLNLLNLAIYQIDQFTLKFYFPNISQYFTTNFYKNLKAKKLNQKKQRTKKLLQRFKNPVYPTQNMTDPQSPAPRYEVGVSRLGEKHVIFLGANKQNRRSSSAIGTSSEVE